MVIVRCRERKLHIQHVRNGGEKRVARYSLDGYCPQTSTAYEYHGCFWHGMDDVKCYMYVWRKTKSNVLFFFLF